LNLKADHGNQNKDVGLLRYFIQVMEHNTLIKFVCCRKNA